MKIYLKENVYDEAVKRINRIFDEFEIVIVSFSGGKDSTAVLNLALQVARERGRLPLKVAFLDQEAEWDATIDYVKNVMYSEEVEPYWFQVPFKIFNASTHDDSWLYCWSEKDKHRWIREKDPISIKENKYGTDRFAEFFEKYIDDAYKGQKACFLGGVRTEESPGRMMGLTEKKTYKDITWGKVLNAKMEHFTFYPIYDWSYTDVWKYIHDNNLEYNKVYDYMFKYGIPTKEMRVSNLTHETALKSLFFMQEVEKENWNKLVKRLNGINTIKHLEEDAIKVKKLPYMFESYHEYREYLLEKLVTNEREREIFRKRFDMGDEMFRYPEIFEDYCKVCCTTIMVNDYHFTKLNNFRSIPEVGKFLKYVGGRMSEKEKLGGTNKYIEAYNKANNIK